MMDINTPRGQRTRELEAHIIRNFPSMLPGFGYLETDKEFDAKNDGILYSSKRNTIYSVCETKCRDMSITELEKRHNWFWLITWDKCERCAHVAREMRCYFTGILYCVSSGDVLMRHLYDGRADKWLVEYFVKETTTQATVNGGTALRENGFFDMRGAKRFRLPVPARLVKPI